MQLSREVLILLPKYGRVLTLTLTLAKSIHAVTWHVCTCDERRRIPRVSPLVQVALPWTVGRIDCLCRIRIVLGFSVGRLVRPQRGVTTRHQLMLCIAFSVCLSLLQGRAAFERHVALVLLLWLLLPHRQRPEHIDCFINLLLTRIPQWCDRALVHIHRAPTRTDRARVVLVSLETVKITHTYAVQVSLAQTAVVLPLSLSLSVPLPSSVLAIRRTARI